MLTFFAIVFAILFIAILAGFAIAGIQRKNEHHHASPRLTLHHSGNSVPHVRPAPPHRNQPRDAKVGH